MASSSQRLPTDDEIEFDPPLGSVPDFTFSHPVLRGASQRWNRGGGINGLVGILRDGGNAKAFHLLVRTTMAMVGIPVLVMLITHTVVLDRLFTFRSAGDKMVWSGVTALCSVQLVIVGFLVAAFREDAADDEAAAAASAKKDS